MGVVFVPKFWGVRVTHQIENLTKDDVVYLDVKFEDLMSDSF